MKFLATLFLFTALCAAQTTKEQCYADLATWQHEAGAAPTYEKLTIEQLEKRRRELLDCAKAYVAYPGAPEKLGWEKLGASYSEAMSLRYQHFIERRKLWEEFLKEDAGGAR